MKREEISIKVKEIMEENLGIQEVGEDSPLEGLESIEILELLLRIEETFGVDIPEEDLPGLKSVKDLVDYIYNYKKTE